MKKQLLTGAFLLASFLTANAQSTTYNFNDLTVGNLGTSFTGQTAGQGGWGTIGSNGAAGTTTTNLATNAAFQVVADSDVARGNVLSIAGPNGSSGGASAFRADTATQWDERTDGYNVHNVTFDYFTGTAVANSQNYVSVSTYSEGGDFVLGGFAIDKSDLGVYAQAYLPEIGTDPKSTDYQAAGNYYLYLGPNQTTPKLPANTWVTFTYSYNSINGDLGIKAVAAGTTLFSGTLTIAGEDADNQVPESVWIETFNGAAGNTVATTSTFDNITVSANPASLLSAPATAVATKFSVFPNPSNGIVTVANTNALINAIAITDINGRTVKNVKVGGVASTEVNISDLASGVYMMSISSDKGTSTQKIVKN
jgi:hypothetical protein